MNWTILDSADYSNQNVKKKYAKWASAWAVQKDTLGVSQIAYFY